jgi:F-box interacting protein
VGSCDGLLVMSIDEYDRTHFFVCNPVTRQWGDLPILRGFHFSGIYPHHPTGQYRLLLYRSQICKVTYEGKVPGDKDSWYVLTLGCDEVPRCIGWPEVEAQHGTPVLVRASLHWYPAKHQTRSKMILAFDTTSESFRLMRAPVLPESAYRFETHGSYLFEMDGMLAMYMHNDAVTVVDIWVLHDYESEVWAFKYRVELLAAEFVAGFKRSRGWNVVVASEGDDVVVLVHFDQWLLHIDRKGRLVASCRHDSKGLNISLHQLQQSLVQHTFFPALQNYQVNDLPFIKTAIDRCGAF